MRNLLFVFTFALLGACANTARDEEVLHVQSHAVLAENGRVLITIDDIPAQVPVTTDIKFGASERLVGASQSPDAAWLAVVTSGAAHSAAWLIPYDGGSAVPVAFQYGGDMSLASWSDDGRYLTVRQLSPSGACSYTQVDLRNLGDTVEAHATSSQECR